MLEDDSVLEDLDDTLEDEVLPQPLNMGGFAIHPIQSLVGFVTLSSELYRFF